MKELLTEKEKLVFEAIVSSFILTANPVASSFIAQNSHLAYSPASIRTIMARLEQKGYIYQPHTSAGRVPTTLGYRLYVDHMMKRARLSGTEKERLRQVLSSNTGDFESVLRESTRILAHLTHQLGIMISPHLEEGIFHRMDITRISSERLLLILSIKSGIVKTIFLEINSGIHEEQLDSLREILNERLHGLKLKEIREKFKEIVEDIRAEDSGLIHIFIRSAKQIFDFSENNEVYLTGTHNILRQPEFTDNEKISGVVELLEDKRIIIRLLGNKVSEEDLNIIIGEEIGEEAMENCSIIAARYKIDNVIGMLGIIGPTRMNYSHLVPLVEFTARVISDPFEQN
ncbi:MAG: heat-inducible transcriptional repressor HrcA [Calditrichia bacterium]